MKRYLSCFSTIKKHLRSALLEARGKEVVSVYDAKCDCGAQRRFVRYEDVLEWRLFHCSQDHATGTYGIKVDVLEASGCVKAVIELPPLEVSSLDNHEESGAAGSDANSFLPESD